MGPGLASGGSAGRPVRPTPSPPRPISGAVGRGWRTPRRGDASRARTTRLSAGPAMMSKVGASTTRFRLRQEWFITKGLDTCRSCRRGGRRGASSAARSRIAWRRRPDPIPGGGHRGHAHPECPLRGQASGSVERCGFRPSACPTRLCPSLSWRHRSDLRARTTKQSPRCRHRKPPIRPQDDDPTRGRTE